MRASDLLSRACNPKSFTGVQNSTFLCMKLRLMNICTSEPHRPGQPDLNAGNLCFGAILCEMICLSKKFVRYIGQVVSILPA